MSEDSSQKIEDQEERRQEVWRQKRQCMSD